MTGLTNLQTEISPVNTVAGDSERFVLSIGARDLVRLGTSLTGVGFTRARRLRSIVRFVSFFAASALRR